MNRHPINPDRIELLTIQQRAERHLLPDELLLKDIGLLIYPEKNDRISFYLDVLQACDEGKIKYTGDIDNWGVNYDCLYFTEKPDENLDYFEKSKRANDKIKEYLNQAQKDTYSVALPPSCYLHREEIKAYFQNINLWPIADCLLANWFGDKQQTEAVAEAGIVKPRKKLKPLERETNEGLLLIYGLCKNLKITYQDELIGIDAWGEIISGKFTSQNIKTYTTKLIVFNSGYKLSKNDFLEKYRKRFAIEE